MERAYHTAAGVWSDIGSAIGLLTRIPSWQDRPRSPDAAWAWPLAGVAAALVAALAGWAAGLLGLEPGWVAAAMLTALIVSTGAMHEDGLADSADGIWGGWDKTGRLAIMKDSHIGSYGVIALVLFLLMRWLALASLTAAGWGIAALLVAGVASRAPMAMTAAVLRPDRDGGLARAVGRPSFLAAWLAAGLAALIAAVILGLGAVWLALWVAAAAALAALYTARKIGGYTGDTLGAVQQVSELAAWAALVALLL